MTDTEIIKALECCKDNSFNSFSCEKCSYHGTCEDALALINRQKAEIERLTAMVEAAEDYLHPLPFKNAFDAEILKAKAEAVKEFAEKLEKDLGDLFMVNHPVVASIIDSLVKEMEGEHEVS